MANPLTGLIVMGSHSVTCRSRQANTPRLNPSQASWYSICLPRMDGRLSWPRCVDSLIESLIPYTAEPTRHRDPSSLCLSSFAHVCLSVCVRVAILIVYGMMFFVCVLWTSQTWNRITGSWGHEVTRGHSSGQWAHLVPISWVWPFFWWWGSFGRISVQTFVS